MGEIYSDLNSDFPYKVTTMNRVQDVTLSAKPYVDLYNQYYSQGDFDRANQVINDHPELLSMMLNMKIVNQIIDEIKATQRTFKDDVESYIFTIVKLRGNYSSAIKYVKYNIVYYNLQPYMAISDDIPIGTLPTNINYWYPLAIKGEQGESGLGLSPRGYWNNSTQYYTDDMVAYNNILWGALSNNINYIPNESSTVWLKLLSFSSEYLTYDNSISGLLSTTMQDAIDELASDIISIETNGVKANGGNSNTVNNYIVECNVPSDAIFTDTIYTHPSTHPYSMITDAPSSLPANGGNADTIDNYHISVVDALPDSPILNTIYFVKK